MAGHPCCCGTTCGGCCNNATAEYIVDFGAGGLVDADCDYCDQVVGEFTLSQPADASADCSGAVDSVCCWSYYDDVICSVTRDCPPPIGSSTQDTAMLIELWLDSDCKWNLRVWFLWGNDDACVCSGHADYKSAAAISSCVGSFTLARTASWSDSGCDFCSGDLPASITLDSV